MYIHYRNNLISAGLIILIICIAVESMWIVWLKVEMSIALGTVKAFRSIVESCDGNEQLSKSLSDYYPSGSRLSKYYFADQLVEESRAIAIFAVEKCERGRGGIVEK
jgi:hypothetical protein